jgi:phospholipase D1/2
MKRKTDRKNRRRRIWLAIGILILLFGVASAWQWSPLAEEINIRRVSAWAVSLRSNPARPLIILGAYVIGSVLLIPITVLIAATALVFGPMLGSAYALAGCLLGAGATYALGYFLGKDFVQKITGPKWKRAERKIGQSGIIAVATLRLLPVAPFTVVNIISGAFKVPVLYYFVGSLLGMIPGILVITLFARQLASAVRNPGLGSFVLLAALILVTVAGTVWLRKKLGNEKS